MDSSLLYPNSFMSSRRCIIDKKYFIRSRGVVYVGGKTAWGRQSPPTCLIRNSPIDELASRYRFVQGVGFQYPPQTDTAQGSRPPFVETSLQVRISPSL